MMTFKKFERLARDHNLVTLQEEVLADTETPVSVFQRFREEPYSFLLESVEGQERWAQYSFIGLRPLELFRSCNRQVEWKIGQGPWRKKTTDDPLRELERRLGRYRPAFDKSLPRFAGGAVGYLGYDMVRFMERLQGKGLQRVDPWDCLLMFPQILMVFDNREHVLRVLYHVKITSRRNLQSTYKKAVAELRDYVARLQRSPDVGGQLQPAKGKPLRFRGLWGKQDFKQAVKRTQEYIRAGDCIQTVLSQRFQRSFRGDPFNIYRALRLTNPSPYLYFLHFGDHDVVGSSPEIMVRREGDQLNLRPIAGTRRRGRNEAEDEALAAELLADPKERAEHIMLVDLGRNDLGRVAKKGSVHVDEFMVIERYSHVMHIVSNVRAGLLQKHNAFDVLRATFPAGTLSGAPKVRAMEIIDELEPTRRGVYGGCVGYIDYSGNMDTAIAIRTAVVHGGTVSVQAGAGIVLDSIPEQEYQECLNKAETVFRAIEMAEQM